MEQPRRMILRPLRRELGRDYPVKLGMNCMMDSTITLARPRMLVRWRIILVCLRVRRMRAVDIILPRPWQTP